MRRSTSTSLFTAALILVGVVHEADAGARRSRPIETGQTTCWDAAGTVIDCAGTGQDGELRRGDARSYQDNGDGTIRDKRAALTWEKLSDDGSIHDKDNEYTWEEAFERIDALNTEPCFAGFCDWRLPNLFELVTLVNLENFNPAVSPAFNTSCTEGCTVLTCSCIKSTGNAWSSSSYKGNPTAAWSVYFVVGAPQAVDKASPLSPMHVRAVRGGAS